MLAQTCFSPHLHSLPAEPPRAGATGPYNPKEAVSSRWHPMQGGSTELVFLLPASREQCPHAGFSANLQQACGDSSTVRNVVPGRPGHCPSVPDHPYSADALLLPHPLSRRNWCIRTQVLLLSPGQGEGFALILLLSDRLSHTRINTADITVCVCLKKMYLDANVASCHHAMRNVVEIERKKI